MLSNWSKWGLIALNFIYISAVFADIKHADTMEQALADANNPDTLVIFDLDNTIIEPVQTLGSDQWIEHLIGLKTKQLVEAGESQDKAKAKALFNALHEWKRAQYVTRVSLGCSERSKRRKVIYQIDSFGTKQLCLYPRI